MSDQCSSNSDVTKSDITKVVHCKKSYYDVYIGRPSIWGNPFSIGYDGSRTEVIDKYEQWIRNQPNLIEKAYLELRGKMLGCWCHPKPCHGDVLVKIIQEIDQNIDTKLK